MYRLQARYEDWKNARTKECSAKMAFDREDLERRLQKQVADKLHETLNARYTPHEGPPTSFEVHVCYKDQSSCQSTTHTRLLAEVVEAYMVEEAESMFGKWPQGSIVKKKSTKGDHCVCLQFFATTRPKGYTAL